MKRLVPKVVPSVPAAEAGEKPSVSESLVFPNTDASEGPARSGGNGIKANGSRASREQPKKPHRSTADARPTVEMSNVPGQYTEASRRVKQWRIAVGNEGGARGDDPSMYERDHRMAEMQDQIEELQHLFRNHENRMSGFRKQQEEKYEDIAERIDLLAEQLFRIEQEKENQRGPNAISLSRIDITEADREAQNQALASMPKVEQQAPEEKVEKMKLEPVQHELRDSESEDSMAEHSKKTVLWENLQQKRIHEKEVLEEQKDAVFEEDWQWKSNAENAFGAFIQKGLQSGLKSALLQCGVMVLLSWIVQFVITYELLEALPQLQEPAAYGHCTNPSSLQLASLGVWFLMMLNNVSSMMVATLITLFADEERNEEGVESTTLRSLPVRIFIFFFAVFSEMAMWSFLLYTGIMFILTAESPVLIVRSTVAITFVQNIDELIYSACATDNIKSDVAGTKYRIKYNKIWCGMQLRTIFNIEWFYSLYCHCLVLTALAFLVVFLARSLEPVRCPTFWQGHAADPPDL